MVNKEKTEYVYIVLIKALTGIGKFARRLTGYEYTHIAISFDEKLTDFITFSRKNHYLALDSGFMHECRSCYAYGEMEDFKVKVFKLPVIKEELENIKNIVSKIENDKEYIFNLFSMVTMPILHGFEIYKTHNCMSFVGLIIKETNCFKMDKLYYKYSISDMDKMMKDYLFYEGYLKKDEKTVENYMKKPKHIYGVKTSLNAILKLLLRMISGKKKV